MKRAHTFAPASFKSTALIPIGNRRLFLVHVMILLWEAIRLQWNRIASILSVLAIVPTTNRGAVAKKGNAD